MSIWDSPMMARRAEAAPKRQARGFQAARLDRFTAGWLAESASIHAELRNDLDRLRARARHLAKNDALAQKYIRMTVAGLVGPPGYTLQSKAGDGGVVDTADASAIESAFAEWSQRGVCDISGQRSFRGICETIAASLPTDGEFLVRKIVGAAARNRFRFTLQLIDVDRIDTTLQQAAGAGRNAIVMGIEIDAQRRPVAYHILTAHPADNNAARVRERIPADEILHGFVADHAEQLRGVPWMAPGILTLHHLGRFEESALLAARNGADRIGFFTTPDGAPPAINDGTGAADETPITVTVPGQYDTLPDGVQFTAYESKYPDAIMGDFVKLYQRRAASAFNVAYNGMANDLEGVNYGSLRGGSIDERDNWMARQEWLIDTFLAPLFDAWLSVALLAGAITGAGGAPLPAGKFAKFRPHRWQGRRWQWIDPLKDIEAQRAAVRSGITSPQRIAAQTGVDIADVIDELRQFESAAAGLQIIDLIAPTAQPAEPAP